jgi:ankyrin repeat protein
MNLFGNFGKKEKDLSDLAKAIRKKDLETSNSILDSFPQLATSEDPNGMTALHFAAENGFIEIAKLLIKKGADANAKNKSKDWTPLHFATYKGNKEMTIYLLSQNLTKETRFNAALLAAFHNQNEIYNIIEDYGKKITEENSKKTAEELLEIGIKHGQNKLWKDSIESLEIAIKKNPNLAKAYMGLFFAHAGLGDFKELMKNYEILRKVDPLMAKQLEQTPTFILASKSSSIVKM